MPTIRLTSSRRARIADLAAYLWWQDCKDHYLDHCDSGPLGAYAKLSGDTCRDYVYRAARIVIGRHVDGSECAFSDSADAKLAASARSAGLSKMHAILRFKVRNGAQHTEDDDARALRLFCASHGRPL